MSKDIKKANKKQKISICCREYFNSDQIILIHSSMINVIALSALLENNTYFGNKVLFAKSDIEKYKNFKEEVKGEVETKNAKEIIRFINEYPLDYQVIDIEEGEKGILEFLKQNKEVIVYTIDEQLKSVIEDNKFRCRIYKKQVHIDKDFPKSVKYISLKEVENRGKLNFINTSPEIKVYNSDKKELEYEEVKLSVGDIILVIQRKEDITKYCIYEVVNYHSKRNLVQVAWTDIKNGEQEIKWIPKEYVEIIEKNL